MFKEIQCKPDAANLGADHATAAKKGIRIFSLAPMPYMRPTNYSPETGAFIANTFPGYPVSQRPNELGNDQCP